MLNVSDPAKQKILALLEAQGRQGSALRVAIAGRGAGGFQYDLRFVDGGDKGPEDVIVDAGLSGVHRPQSAPNLGGRPWTSSRDPPDRLQDRESARYGTIPRRKRSGGD
jgi:Fe-S cluster assembly iron-binding protein IscA